jgi:hypothetical protein
MKMKVDAPNALAEISPVPLLGLEMKKRPGVVTVLKT